MRQVEADEFAVEAVQYLDDPQIWIVLAGATQAIEVSQGSAARLHAALGRLLAEVGHSGSDPGTKR